MITTTGLSHACEQSNSEPWQRQGESDRQAASSCATPHPIHPHPHHAGERAQKMGELQVCKERKKDVDARIDEKIHKILDHCKSSPVVQTCPMPGNNS